MTAHPKGFDPASLDPRAFRTALGRFATGVTVVTCTSEKGPVGMTANSFASVSLDPPLVLWSPAKSSARHSVFTQASHFAIHVLRAEQRDLCAGFARTASTFDGVDWTANAQGVPLLEGCLARFECAMFAAHDAGDHSIVVGQVERFACHDGAPLMFFGGKYGDFSGHE